jgi:outer membrane receptor for ferrienterochelin and colicins
MNILSSCTRHKSVSKKFRDLRRQLRSSSRLFLSVAALLLASISGVLADTPAANQDAAFSDMSLDELMSLEVFSAASRLPTKRSKAPGTVYSFERGDFARMGVRRLDDLLQFVPGMQLNQYRKRHRSIWSRGLLDRYNDKLILLVDGIQQRHLYYGHFSLGENFPLEKIEKVEIIQGPASSLYGANAFGGIISITTRMFSDKPGTELTLEAGNHSRGKGTALVNGPNMQAFASYLNQDAPFRDDRKSFIGGETLQPLDEDYGNVFLKGSPVKGLTLSMDYNRSDTTFLFIPDTQDAFIEERSLTLGARYEIGNLEQGKLEATLHYTEDNAREYEIESVTRALGYEENQDATMAGATVTGFKRLFEKHVVALGLSWQHERAENMDFNRYFRFDQGFLDSPVSGSLLSDPSIRNNDYALFVQDVWELTPEVSLTLGGRYDNFDQFGDYFNYRGALVYEPDARQTWKLLYGTAIRTPSFREYLKVLEGTGFIALIPEPEKIESLELAYLFHWAQANLSVTLFHNNVEDFIHEVPTPDGEDEYFANSDNTRRMDGVETLLGYSLHEDLMLRLSVSYLDVEDSETGEVPYLASWTSSLNLNYRYSSKQNIGFSLVYNNDRTDTNDFVDDDSDSFTIANIFGSGEITSAVSYGFGIDNVFDEKVFDPAADFGGQHNTERSEREYWLRLQWRSGL